MGEEEIEYQSGSVIYSEKESGNAAFLIISGTVELYHNGDLITECRPGEYFGEIEVMDNTIRLMSAIAKTKLLVKKIDRNDFITLLKMDGDASINVVKGISKKMLLLSKHESKLAFKKESVSDNNIIKKLSPSRSLIKRDLAKGEKIEKGGKKNSFLSFLFRNNSYEPPINAPTVIIPAIIGDDEHNYQDFIASIIKELNGIRVKTYEQTMPTNDINKAFMVGNSWLKDKHANLVLWIEKEKNAEAITIRYIPRNIHHDIPGMFNIYNKLRLATDFSTEEKELLKGVTVGAIPSLSYEQSKILKHLLPENLRNLNPPTSIADNLFCYGKALASAGNFDIKSNFYHQAEESYKECLELYKEKEKIYRSEVYYQLGLIYQTKGEVINDLEILYKSASAYDEAIQNVDRLNHPKEWALFYLKLGSVLYKIAQLGNDNDTYEQAMNAYKNSLDIYNKNFEPMRCAEALNGLGLTMHVMAEHLKNQDLAKNAVKLYVSSLEIRNKEEAPLLWSATKNNMSSAQFLLGRLTGEPEYYINAINGFKEALDMYEKSNSYRMAMVTTKNLKRAEEEFRKIGGIPGLARSTKISLPELFKEEEEEESKKDSQ